MTTTLYWVRKDFRLTDNLALQTALDASGRVIPVCLLDEVVEKYGAAPKWRWGEAIREFANTLHSAGTSLVLRRGQALTCLRKLIAETGATRVVWGRQYDPDAKTRDMAVKTALKEDGIDAVSVCNHLLFEPWKVTTKTGGPYRVYTPFKNACLANEFFSPAVPAPADLKAPDNWPHSESLDDWKLEKGMNRGAQIVSQYTAVGETAARERLDAFLTKVTDYKRHRDIPEIVGTSRLSENLAWGEISPLTIWSAVRESAGSGSEGAKVFLSEILWREFAYHLLHHYPDIGVANWREQWNAFPWKSDNIDAKHWRRGLTGLPFIDAAMRELYTTGTMHNRLRMLTASVLTKHLMTDWRIGEKWFSDCLIDWDPASNAMGWQWAAGSGPDAAPFFRIFNPETQREKFDPDNTYVKNWLEIFDSGPSKDTENFYAAVPKTWRMNANAPYPAPIVDLKTGRERALAAYKEMRE